MGCGRRAKPVGSQSAHGDLVLPNNPGAISNATFTITPANIDATAQITEWRNVATLNPLDVTGNFAPGANQLSGTVSTAPTATANANELVITAMG